MVSVERISFVTEGDEADERVIREYIVPSLDRLEAIERCEGVRFTRFGMDPRWERSEVKLGIYGDYEAVINAERDRWDELASEGLIESWSRDGKPFSELPEEIQELCGRNYTLASHMAAVYFEECDKRPGLVDEITDGKGRPWGLWAVIHILLNQMGYSADKEVEAYMLLLRDRLTALTEFQSHDDVREMIDDCRNQLDELEETVDELEEQGGFDYYSGPE